jgi:hypothetical protein
MPTAPPSAVRVVAQWLDAVNAQDAGRLLELSAPHIRIVGPRGTAHGADVLRDWLVRARASLTTRSTFAAGARVVVAQHAAWRGPSGEVLGEAEVASRFVVEGGRVAEYERHDALFDALARAGLTVDDWT